MKDVAGIRDAVISFFTSHFIKDIRDRPTLDGINLPLLSPAQVVSLSGRFSMEKIKDVVMSCNGNKSSSLNGFNFAFVKAFWLLIKDDLKNHPILVPIMIFMHICFVFSLRSTC